MVLYHIIYTLFLPLTVNRQESLSQRLKIIHYTHFDYARIPFHTFINSNFNLYIVNFYSTAHGRRTSLSQRGGNGRRRNNPDVTGRKRSRSQRQLRGLHGT